MTIRETEAGSQRNERPGTWQAKNTAVRTQGAAGSPGAAVRSRWRLAPQALGGVDRERGLPTTLPALRPGAGRAWGREKTSQTSP